MLKARYKLLAALVFLTAIASASAMAAVDAGAARTLARRDSCMRCHAPMKEKEGPSFHAIADKYKNDAGALESLVQHITSGEKVKLSDGHEENHKIAKAKNAGEIRNLIAWILQQ